jgi:hypothetical protein
VYSRASRLGSDTLGERARVGGSVAGAPQARGGSTALEGVTFIAGDANAVLGSFQVSRGSSVQSANVCEEMYYKLHLGKDGARRASTSERTWNALGTGERRSGTREEPRHTREGDARLRAGWEE